MYWLHATRCLGSIMLEFHTTCSPPPCSEGFHYLTLKWEKEAARNCRQEAMGTEHRFRESGGGGKLKVNH